MPNQTVAVVFGGRSVEHEVSILTAHQVLDALDVAGFKTLPVYINKDGAWYAGKPLGDLAHFRGKAQVGDLAGVNRVALAADRSIRQLVSHPHAKKGLFSRPPELWADVFLPCVHGSFGEDGTLQGVFEMADVAYTGCGVLAAALSMDKIRSKAVCQAAGLPVLECRWTTRRAWAKEAAAFVAEAEKLGPYPLIVKPASLGSSIGVRRCDNQQQLREGVETALVYDERVLVEPALVSFREVNCSVLGPPTQASVCEMPSYAGELLSFDSKYRAGGSGKGGAKRGGSKGAGAKGMAQGGMASLNRTIPAPISPELTAQAQQLAMRGFEAIGAEGVARVDFLLDSASRLYFNEINTVPGSLAYYLWESSGLRFDQLVTRLVESGLERHASRRQTQYSMDANLLGGAA
jgi:D-alanine-D-alanine ligase